MQTKTNTAATTQNGESVQTDAVPAQSQPRTAPDGTTAGNSPAAVGAEAMITKTPSITVALTNIGRQRPADARTDPGTIVPPLNPGTISKLSDNDLIAACKSQFRVTNSSYSLFQRDKELLGAIYDEMVDRFRDENLKGEKRDGKPTLRQAFGLAGWNYDAARKFRQRHEQDKNRRILTSYENPAKPPLLLEGDIVKLKDAETDAEYVVVNVHESAPKVDVVPKSSANGKTLTVAAESVTKVVIPVRKIKMNDLILCDDNGAEYQYVGGGKLSRTKTPTLLEQKRERELAAINAKKHREAAKAEEKKRQQELRKAEAARRDIEKIAEKDRRRGEANAKKAAGRLKKAAVETAKVKNRSKVASSQLGPTPTKAELVKVARIGDMQEFGLFPESCSEYTAGKALKIGTRGVCEAERERINAKRLAEQGAAGNAPAAAATVAAPTRATSTLAEVRLG
jgi:hypothetical protein